ncbi:hypothetical protein KEU06_28120 [Pseudaminobacter sp. 19-2017]|uniref:Uncharacterized protein n=1 Tax=Pseudaminobacter soli (ex Zhang et al. 2022) TaxID=2831468 RepID=A0A942I481_9HYPH|nr:hypothetical protein [Pseudaminobacter soli]MBS3652457.1 hypothetical protein [Pseudaminobacter soli]
MRILYLDQNAWVALARGAWDKAEYPREHAALATVVALIEDRAIITPLSFTNLYETAKINDPVRRAHLARVQAVISGGHVFRGRRRIFAETLADSLAKRFSLEREALADEWFLSSLWFEAAADYSAATYGLEISARVLDHVRANPIKTLFEHLAYGDEAVRVEAVRRYSMGSAGLVAQLEARRAIVAGETFAVRRRAYGARLILDEIDFILATARRLGLAWQNVHDISSSLMRSLPSDIPVLNVERELVIRLEDQTRKISENDLRDVAAFTTVLPFATVMVAEKPFVNLARQARLGTLYETTLLTSVFELSSDLF